VISDTHFGHLGVCKFLREDGTKLRPWDDPDEMDEEMIKRWNDTVRPNDKVYHLGDVVINRKALNVLYRLNGDKVLIKGNHDIFKLADYTPFFRDIRAYHVIDKMVLSHVPMHEESIERWTANIHGHLHYRRVLKNNKIDPRYHNVSVEHTDYRPILFEDVLERIKKEQGK
jgi:calcineurin-like phosphoesterase family protein